MRRALVVAGLPSSLGFGIAGPSSAKEIVTSETCRDYGDASEPSSTVGLIAPPESDRAQRAPVYGEAGGRARVLEDRRNDQSVRWRGAIHDDSPCTGSATVRAGIDTSLTSEYGADHTVDLPPYGRANADHGPFIEDTCARASSHTSSCAEVSATNSTARAPRRQGWRVTKG